MNTITIASGLGAKLHHGNILSRMKRSSSMQILLLILTSLFLCAQNQLFGQSFSVKYRVNSTSSVVTSGSAPAGSSAIYSQTYVTAQQLTGGNHALLRLVGFAGYKITGLNFEMRSNASSGKGSLNVIAGTTNIFSIPDLFFNDPLWNGIYTNNYTYLNKVPTTSYNILSGDTVKLRIDASINSLYIQEFEIIYEPVVMAPCTLASNAISPAISNCVSNAATVSWSHSLCYDEYLVVAKAGAFSALPTGNGSTYTANAAFGSGTAFDGGFVVYKGTANSVNISNLTNGVNYTYKIFTRKGTDWSSGVEVNCTPIIPPVFTTCLTASLTSTTAPSGWLSTGVTFMSLYADMASNNGTLTTIAVSYPSQLKFMVSRTTNTTAKTLNIRVSTTSQTAGFTTIKSLTNDSTASGGSTNFTIDLSAYSSSPNVYIQFEKVSSTTSPWRLNNVEVLCGAPPVLCTTATSLTFETTTFAPVEDAIIPSFNVALTCSSGVVSSCNSGTITLSTNGCGLSGNLTASVVNGKATFNNISFTRSLQNNVHFTATYSGSCAASTLSGQSSNFNVSNPPFTPIYNTLKDMDFSTNVLPWTYNVGTPIVVGTGGGSGTDVTNVVTLAGNTYLRKSYSINNGSDERGTTNTITFDNVPVNTAYAHQLFVKVASLDNFGGITSTSGGGADTGEDLVLETSFDGGTTWVHTFTQVGFSNKMFTFTSLPQVTIPYNAGISYTNKTSNFLINIPAGNSQIAFRVTANNNRIQEIWGIDDIVLREVVPPSIASSPLPDLSLNTPVVVCMNSTFVPSFVINDAVTPVVYSWVPHSDISNVNISNPTITGSTNNQAYYLVATDADQCKDTSFVTVNFPTGTVGEWIGGVSRDWFDCLNWGSGRIPDSTTNVIIGVNALDSCEISYSSLLAPTSPVIGYANNVNISEMSLIVNDNGSQNARLYVRGNVDVNANNYAGVTQLRMQTGGLIRVGNNWVNRNSAFNPGNGTVNFRGPVNAINNMGSNPEQFYRLGILNNTTLTLQSDVIALIVDWNGIVNPQANQIIQLGIDPLNSGVLNYTAGYASGIMRRYFSLNATSGNEGFFPLGKNGNYRYAEINFTSATGTSGYLDAEYVLGNPGTNGLSIATANTGGFGMDIDQVESEGYWRVISGTSALNTTNYNAHFSAENLSAFPGLANVSLIKRNDLASAWTAPATHVAASGTSTFPVVSRNGLSGFSHFAFGYPNSPLPVTLGSFDVKCNDGFADITWETLQESNSDYFEIQASKNGINYVEIDRVSAAGNSNESILYSYKLLNRDGYRYWRLKQVDYNLDYEIFGAKYQSCELKEASCAVQINGNGLQMMGPEDAIYTWTIYSLDGKKMYQTEKSGVHTYNAWQHIAPGIYVVQAQSATHKEVFKIFKP